MSAAAPYPMPPAMLALLEPPEQLTVSQRADRHRYLPAGDNAEPGPFRTATTPYMREVMDAAGDPDVRQVVFIKCSRVGGTEAINNVILDTIDGDPKPIMYVQPTREDVEDEFTGRLRLMIESSQRLARHVEGMQNWCTKHLITTGPCKIFGAWPTNPQTMVRKTIGLVIFDEIDNAEAQVGYLGNSLQVLKERIVTYGDRGKVFVNGTPTVATAAGWRMLQESDWRKYHVPCPLCGTYQVLRFGRIVIPELYEGLAGVQSEEISAGRIKLTDKLPPPAVIRRDQLARYQCEGCDGLLDWHKHSTFMRDRGVWIPRGVRPVERLPVAGGAVAVAGARVSPEAIEQAHQEHAKRDRNRDKHDAGGDAAKGPGRVKKRVEGRGLHAGIIDQRREIVEKRSLAVQPPGETQWAPALEGEPPVTDVRGYHINVLYSPFESRTWSQILAEFHQRYPKRDERRVFINSWLAEPFKDATEELTEQELAKKREEEWATPRGIVPWWAKMLLASADVQPDGVWFRVRAVGARGRSMGIFETFLTHQGAGNERVTDLQQAYALAFYNGFALERDPATERADDGGASRRGDCPGPVAPVLVRCRALAVDSGYAARLDEVMEFAELPGVCAVKGETGKRYAYDSGSRDPFRRSKNVRNLYLLNVDHYKSKIHRRIRLAPSNPQAYGFHRDTSDEFLRHICSEHQVAEVVKSGRRKGRPTMVWRLKVEGVPNHGLDNEVYIEFLADLYKAELFTDLTTIAESDLITVAIAAAAGTPAEAPQPENAPAPPASTSWGERTTPGGFGSGRGFGR